MEFLLEPLELGTEIEDLLSENMLKITCDEGYACKKGTV